MKKSIILIIITITTIFCIGRDINCSALGLKWKFTPKQAVTSYPVTDCFAISMFDDDSSSTDGWAIIYDDPYTKFTYDYIIIWRINPKKMYSIFYRKKLKWYSKTEEEKPKLVTKLIIGKKEIF